MKIRMTSLSGRRTSLRQGERPFERGFRSLHIDLSVVYLGFVASRRTIAEGMK